MPKEIKKSKILPVKSSIIDGKTGEVIQDSDLDLSPEAVKKNKILYTGLEGKLIFIRVGNDRQEATDEEIVSIENQLKDKLDEADVNCILFVTHHAVDIQVVG